MAGSRVALCAQCRHVADDRGGIEPPGQGDTHWDVAAGAQPDGVGQRLEEDSWWIRRNEASLRSEGPVAPSGHPSIETELERRSGGNSLEADVKGIPAAILHFQLRVEEKCGDSTPIRPAWLSARAWVG